MVQSIVSGLEDRFPEGDLLDNSAIFDVASYRGKSAKEIAEYGEDEFMMILKHFSQPADKHRWFVSQPSLWARDQGKRGCEGAGQREARESHQGLPGVQESVRE
jgi:hypothetical protein